MNVTMTGGKRKVCHTAYVFLCSIAMVAMLVANSRLWTTASDFEGRKSLTCLAVDEPESYCLDDEGEIAVEEGLEGDGSIRERDR